MAQRWFKIVKLCEFVLSGLDPIAALAADGLVTAVIGAGAVFLEALATAQSVATQLDYLSVNV